MATWFAVAKLSAPRLRLAPRSGRRPHGAPHPGTKCMKWSDLVVCLLPTSINDPPKYSQRAAENNLQRTISNLGS